MARFANTAPLRPKSLPYGIGNAPTEALTFEAGVGFSSSDPHAELFNASVSGLLADQFYESADKRIERLIDLVRLCHASWLRDFIPWLRSGAHLRSAPIVLAAEYARHFPTPRGVVASALQRADEPAEMLGYWMARYGRAVPKPVKRGIADAVTRLYTERSAMRYDGSSKTWRFGDVIEFVHPTPKDEKQAALFRFLLDRRRHGAVVPQAVLPKVAATLAMEAVPAIGRTPMALYGLMGLGAEVSWERAGGWLAGGLTAEAWGVLIPSMGYMALMRNLNNFDRAGVRDSARKAVQERLTDPEEIASSRVLPFRFQTAYKNLEADTYKVALGTAADMAVANLPEFPGATLIMVDCSGSMVNPVGGGKSRNPLTCSETAGFLAEALGRRCEKAAIVCYDSDILSAHAPQRHVGLLTAAKDARYAARGGTYTWRCTNHAYSTATVRFDRVVILTDEQAADHDDGSIKVPVITWNLAGYQAHHAEHGARNRFFVAGYNDTVLQTLPAVIAAGSTGRWPWQ